MRIAHVVTYVSSDGSFGGPTRVALAQAEALAELGHEVVVYAGAPPSEVDDVESHGYRLRTFPAKRIIAGRGFASMYSPQLARALKREARSYQAGHVHMGRDLVTLPAALAMKQSGLPFVVQPHGMIARSRNPIAAPLDIALTRTCLRAASEVFVLTMEESAQIEQIEDRVKPQFIRNGIKLSAPSEYAGRPRQVLFLARLQERKRPLAFVEMARVLKKDFPDVNFIIAGPDEGQGEEVRRAISSADMGDRLTWIGPLSPTRTDEVLSNSLVYVLPSFNEVFPMTIIEAFRAGTPVVATTSLGIASDCERYGAAALTDGSPASMAREVAELLESPDAVDRALSGASRYLRSELDINAVALQLESTYASIAR